MTLCCSREEVGPWRSFCEYIHFVTIGFDAERFVALVEPSMIIKELADSEAMASRTNGARGLQSCWAFV